jgi:hypothetical protein
VSLHHPLSLGSLLSWHLQSCACSSCHVCIFLSFWNEPWMEIPTAKPCRGWVSFERLESHVGRVTGKFTFCRHALVECPLPEMPMMVTSVLRKILPRHKKSGSRPTRRWAACRRVLIICLYSHYWYSCTDVCLSNVM